MEKFSKWLSPIIALFFVTALSVTASSTIGTSITTGGDLDVTGTTTSRALVLGVTPFDPESPEYATFDPADYAPLASPSFSGTVGLPSDVSSGSGTTFDTGGDGSAWIFTASGGGDIILNPSAGGETALQGRVRLVPVSAEPVACAAGSAGTIAYSDLSDYLCVCDGASYVQVASTTQACVFVGV
ncbi:MAG: hypothetical protein NUW02_03460 [Candidatus Campbellbacteria bacterium]|nr:hypothetical protein [Candidatus Campbellbacteria bacterium]